MHKRGMTTHNFTVDAVWCGEREGPHDNDCDVDTTRHRRLPETRHAHTHHTTSARFKEYTLKKVGESTAESHNWSRSTPQGWTATAVRPNGAPPPRWSQNGSGTQPRLNRTRPATQPLSYHSGNTSSEQQQPSRADLDTPATHGGGWRASDIGVPFSQLNGVVHAAAAFLMWSPLYALGNTTCECTAFFPC